MRHETVRRAHARRSAPVFAALGDETRLRLVARLCDAGPLSIVKLTVGADMTRQAITKHLHVLQHAGLVRERRRGRESAWQSRHNACRRRGATSTRSLSSGIRRLDGSKSSSKIHRSGDLAVPRRRRRRSAPCVPI